MKISKKLLKSVMISLEELCSFDCGYSWEVDIALDNYYDFIYYKITPK
jgi:hypothetical protein